MNKKIEEIIEQCSTDVGSYDPYGENRIIKFDKEKFAEMIVKECANRVDHILREKSLGGGTYADDIKEYFGVGK